MIFSASGNIDIAAARVQSILNNIANYLSNRGLLISPEKSQIMVFNKNKYPIGLNRNLVINNSTIPRTPSTRFLGVWLDEKLIGKAHLQYLITKCRKLVDIISSLASVKWGSHPTLLLNLYKATIRSVIDYGSQIYQFKGNSQQFLTLTRLQYRALRTALGLRISTPINVLLNEAREPPLHIRTHTLTLNSYTDL